MSIKQNKKDTFRDTLRCWIGLGCSWSGNRCVMMWSVWKDADWCRRNAVASSSVKVHVCAAHLLPEQHDQSESITRATSIIKVSERTPKQPSNVNPHWTRLVSLHWHHIGSIPAVWKLLQSSGFGHSSISNDSVYYFRWWSVFSADEIPKKIKHVPKRWEWSHLHWICSFRLPASVRKEI